MTPSRTVKADLGRTADSATTDAALPAADSAAVEPGWAHAFGGLYPDEGRAVALGPGGNLYAAGNFRGVAAFGNAGLTAKGEDGYVAKLAPGSGGVVWSRALTTPGVGRVLALAVDPQGNVLAGGAFSEVVSIETTKRGGFGLPDIFVVKISPAGAVVWLQTFGSSGVDTLHALASDDAGNVLLTGRAGGNIALADRILKHDPGGAFLARLAPDGAVRWARSIKGRGVTQPNGIAANKHGEVVAVGSFTGPTVFGDVELSPAGAVQGAGYADIFVFKLDPDGKPLWARQAGGTRFDSADDVAIDGGDNILITGNSWNAATFGALPLVSTGSDMYVAKLDTAGTFHWVTSGGGPGTFLSQGIDVDQAGNAYVAGAFTGAGAFAGHAIQSQGQTDVFVARFTAAGNRSTVATAGGPLTDMALGLALDTVQRKIYVTGRFGGLPGTAAHTYGGTALNSHGYFDSFVWQLTAP